MTPTNKLTDYVLAVRIVGATEPLVTVKIADWTRAGAFKQASNLRKLLIVAVEDASKRKGRNK